MITVSEGQRFGRGVVICTGIRCGKRMKPGAVMLCDCGQHYAAMLADLRAVAVRSCGCLLRETRIQNGKASAAREIHGLTHRGTRHPLYFTWTSMLRRCENPDHPAYPNYGGRGISVCPRWRDVAAFIADIESTIGPRPEGMTLDRIRNGLGYKPSNVRWATALEQRHNRRVAAGIGGF